MEVLFVILGIAVIVGLSLLWGYLKRQATRALNRNVFNRGKHQRGQATTQEVIEFTAPVPAATVIAAVRDRLQLTTTPPTAFVAALHLIDEKPGLLVFGYGTKLQLSFRSALASDDLPGGSSSSTYQMLNWTEGDGIVRGIAEMELLANAVRVVAADLGGSLGPAPAGTPAPAVAAPTAPAPTEPTPTVRQRYCESCGSDELGERFCTACGEALPV